MIPAPRPTLPPRDALHTADQAAEVLQVPAARIRAWKREGKIAAAGMLESRGRGGLVPLYRLEELAPLVRRYHLQHPPRHPAQAPRLTLDPR